MLVNILGSSFVARVLLVCVCVCVVVLRFLVLLVVRVCPGVGGCLVLVVSAVGRLVSVSFSTYYPTCLRLHRHRAFYFHASDSMKQLRPQC